MDDRCRCFRRVCGRGWVWFAVLLSRALLLWGLFCSRKVCQQCFWLAALQSRNVHTSPIRRVGVWHRAQGESILRAQLERCRIGSCGQPVKHAANATGESKCAGDTMHAGRKPQWDTFLSMHGYAAASCANDRPRQLRPVAAAAVD